MLENLKGHRIKSAYSVASPSFDPKTRTLSSFHKRSDAGDCGTIAEWKWTGWYFQLLYVWSKTQCDGEPFEWDDRFSLAGLSEASRRSSRSVVASSDLRLETARNDRAAAAITAAAGSGSRPAR